MHPGMKLALCRQGNRDSPQMVIGINPDGAVRRSIAEVAYGSRSRNLRSPRCQPDLAPLRIYSDGTVLTTDRVSSAGLHSGSGFLDGSLTALRSLGLLTTGWSTWARAA